MFVNPKQYSENALVNKIKDYLQGNDDQKPTNDEISQGMFVHCLLVALQQLDIINKELKKVIEDLKEEKLAILEETINKVKIHHREEEYQFEDEDKLRGKLMKEFAKLLDPDTLAKTDQVYEQLTPIVERTANLLYDDKKFRATTDENDPGNMAALKDPEQPKSKKWPPKPTPPGLKNEQI